MVEQAKVQELVFSAISEYNEQTPTGEQLALSRGTILLGDQGELDSLGLLTLLLAVEKGIAKRFGKQVPVLSEKAISQEPSPLGSVGTLVDYVCEVVQEC